MDKTVIANAISKMYDAISEIRNTFSKENYNVFHFELVHILLNSDLKSEYSSELLKIARGINITEVDTEPSKDQIDKINLDAKELSSLENISD